jgi:hypothetical protein
VSGESRGIHQKIIATAIFPTAVAAGFRLICRLLMEMNACHANFQARHGESRDEDG